MSLVLLAAGYAAIKSGRFPRLQQRFHWSRSSGWIVNIALLISAPVIALACLESFTQGLQAIGLLDDKPPLETLLPANTEDWREAHITADRYREADPKLLWRPVASAPYSAQRFKGPVVSAEKPRNTFRIMTYGDSNTDGPDRGGWPEVVGEILSLNPKSDIKFEVLNAGVVGYSSYQGLQRFLEEADIYQPDLILVSFGWNDLASTTGTPDREYQAPSPNRVWLVRILVQYHFYRAVRSWVISGKRPSDSPVISRVPLEHYRENLESFLREAQVRGIEIIFLTRPHRETRHQLLQNRQNWRSQVPLYNREVIRLSRRQRASMIDVQKAFANKKELFSDECHFTLEGHRQMALLVTSALLEQELLPRR